MPNKKSLSPVEYAKELLADPKSRLIFYDFMKEKSDGLITDTSEDLFPVNTPWQSEEFTSRLKRYEYLSSDLMTIMALIGTWGTPDHLLSASLPAKQVAPLLGSDVRQNHWTELRWYPLLLLTYALGISVVANDNYSILYNFLQTSVKFSRYSSHPIPLVLALEDGFDTARQQFKALPGHERQFTPVSEYLFSLLNNKLKDTVLFGDDYEDFFDRFEIVFSFQCAHERNRIMKNYGWLPIGRFGWKYSRASDSSPLLLLCQEASQKKDEWPPIKAGFFGGVYEQFETIAQQYMQRLQNFH